MTLPLKQRHFRPIPGLARRTTSDISPEALEARFRVTMTMMGERSKPSRPSLVSTCDGSIDELFLAYPTYAAQDLREIYVDFIRQMPQKTKFIVAHHLASEAETKAMLTEAGARDRSRLVSVPDHLHFSVWAEDGYVISVDQDGGATYFIEPFSFPRYGDSLLADFACNATDYVDTQAPLYFQGGNVLVGDSFFLIGADYPANSLAYTRTLLVPNENETPEQLVYRLYKEYFDVDRELTYVGSTIPVPSEKERPFTLDGQTWNEFLYLGNHAGTAQPLFHIDMFITLVGRRDDKFTLLVGDPAMAARLLDAPLLPHAMSAVFDNIARGLEAKGFEVVRNALPLTYYDDPGARERIWYFATSNNCLVQNSADDHLVWLPTYGHGSWPELAQTDEANVRVWEGLGYRVQRLGDFHPFAQNLGAVHCIKKYLKRT